MKGNYKEKGLYPCWKSVVYVVADGIGGRNPAAARVIAKNWKGELGILKKVGAIQPYDCNFKGESLKALLKRHAYPHVYACRIEPSLSLKPAPLKNGPKPLAKNSNGLSISTGSFVEHTSHSHYQETHYNHHKKVNTADTRHYIFVGSYASSSCPNCLWKSSKLNHFTIQLSYQNLTTTLFPPPPPPPLLELSIIIWLCLTTTLHNNYLAVPYHKHFTNYSPWKAQ